MSGRSALRLGGLLLGGMLTAAGCQGSSGDAPESAPSTVSPGTSVVSPAPGATTGAAAEAKLQQARRALQTFMRRSTVGDTSACGHVAPKSDFERQVFKGDCREGVKDMPHFIKPDERRALVTVRVSGGTIDPAGEVSIPFTNLSWSDGNMTVHTVQPVFVLREMDGIWKIIR
ncbi:hypothetical protein [Actinomadura sp. HBU206391]|uniref:hypothetical protein n=1 Tax=Actinomadura sp. HBU206391 TaxID=2731692 RepID=UPI0016500F46|nr:hypothetical protein [Actinomadura sp. HBU206391]MBC6460848.1 hypothetical protein [Actinomadura sp. HBU206391]